MAGKRQQKKLEGKEKQEGKELKVDFDTAAIKHEQKDYSEIMDQVNFGLADAVPSTDSEQNDEMLALIMEEPNLKDTHKYCGVYLENDVADKLDEIAGRKRGGKSRKSRLVNGLVRRFLESQNLL